MIILQGQYESAWSMIEINSTQEAKPASPPRDLTAVKSDEKPQSVILNWQPPKFSNGQIIGKLLKAFQLTDYYILIYGLLAYQILYTTDNSSSDHDWVAKTVEGELMSFTVKDLAPNTNYYFKIQAKNAVGYGPFSPFTNIKTMPGIILINVY